MAAGDLITSWVQDPAVVLQGGIGNDSKLVLILKSDIASYSQVGINPLTAITLAANKISGIELPSFRQKRLLNSEPPRTPFLPLPESSTFP